jgi:hypothetical protein
VARGRSWVTRIAQQFHRVLRSGWDLGTRERGERKCAEAMGRCYFPAVKDDYWPGRPHYSYAVSVHHVAMVHSAKAEEDPSQEDPTSEGRHALSVGVGEEPRVH